jgi:putative transcriptional regulator
MDGLLSDGFFEKLSFDKGVAAKGKVLISEPFLFDPTFKRTVILLVEHNKEGSLGFILNKNSTYKVNELVDTLDFIDEDLHLGGPVGKKHLYYLHTLGNKLEGSTHIVGNIYWGGDFEKLKTMFKTGLIADDEVRFFAGYSGWSPGQLEQELEEKSWIVTELNDDIIMKARSKAFWSEALKKLGSKFKIMSNFPENPNMN